MTATERGALEKFNQACSLRFPARRGQGALTTQPPKGHGAELYLAVVQREGREKAEEDTSTSADQWDQRWAAARNGHSLGEPDSDWKGGGHRSPGGGLQLGRRLCRAGAVRGRRSHPKGGPRPWRMQPDIGAAR